MIEITIEQLRIPTIIGVFEKERKKKQTIFITVKFTYDDTKAAKTDDVKYAIDYFEMKNLLIKKIETSSFKLLESLSDYIINLICSNYTINSIEVIIEKPNALKEANNLIISKKL